MDTEESTTAGFCAAASAGSPLPTPQRPPTWDALAEVHVASGDSLGARAAATALTEEFGGTEHALSGYAALHALAVDAGDRAAAEAALGAAEALWPEHVATAMMRQDHALRLGEGAGGRAAPGAAPAASHRAGSGALPAEPTLEAPYPNPSDGAVTVPLVLPAAAGVSVAAYDVLGRRVALLHEGPLGAGRHALRLDARPLAPGVYVVRAEVSAGSGAPAVLHGRFTLLR